MLAPLLLRLERTLRGGGKVFWVGELAAPPAGEPPPRLPPAPSPVFGWSDVPYYEAWKPEAGAFLSRRSTAFAQLSIAGTERVGSYEIPPVFVLEGWRDAVAVAGTPWHGEPGRGP